MNNLATKNTHHSPQEQSGQGSAYRRGAQQQILICLQSSAVQFTLDPIQCFEALKSSLGILRQLLHWKQLLEERNAIHAPLAAPSRTLCLWDGQDGTSCPTPPLPAQLSVEGDLTLSPGLAIKTEGPLKQLPHQ